MFLCSILLSCFSETVSSFGCSTGDIKTFEVPSTILFLTLTNRLSSVASHNLNFSIDFKNSLIIHEENTKKNHKRVLSLYVDKDFPSFT